MTRGLILWAVLLGLLLATIALLKPPTDPPLLVDASLTNGRGPSVVCVPTFPSDVRPSKDRRSWA